MAEATHETVSEAGGSLGRPDVGSTSSRITWANRWDHFLSRWGVNRMGHRVEPGLYALGSPAADSPVFVTANYTLSFDALRSSLPESDGYILVLDTQAVNVWCAAGKGTFGTEELVRRIEATRLREVVNHRVLIVPQLGAAGVAAHEVTKQSGFKVEYGPVRAADLPPYLKTGEATAAMRQVGFGLRDRVVLVPMELVHALLPMVIAAVVLFFVAGRLSAAGAVAAILAGAIVFPMLLPWIPTHDFSSKGLMLGGAAMLPFALESFLGRPGVATWVRLGWALTYPLALSPVTAFLALNFTGSTTFTSRSGVKREIFSYVPIMALMIGASVLLIIVLLVTRLLGGAR